MADLVWSRLGDVQNYIEPFAGSLAALLRRPADHTGKVETVNDASHFIVNFWRSVEQAPDEVAKHADWPVNEADLHTRHRWLMQGSVSAEFRARMAHDPEAFDARIAGWWCWGQCCWIGGGWCSGWGLTADGDTKRQMPDVAGDSLGRGDQANHAKRPLLREGGGRGVNGLSQQVPDLAGDAGTTGRGVAAASPKLPINGGRPQLGDVYDIGRGVLGNGKAGTCEARRAWLIEWMGRLSDRLRLTRTCYGDWERVCGSRTTTTRIGLTGVFLDPPYAVSIERMHAWLRHLQGQGDPPKAEGKAQRHADLYANDKTQDVDHLVARVLVWCLTNGDDPQMRIAVCGYDGEHNTLEERGWEVEAWKAHGGYGNRSDSNDNKTRERIWFSPACFSEADVSPNLFTGPSYQEASDEA